jgi:hypothetical protein
VGADDPNDGEQTLVDYRFDLLPPSAIFAVAARMKHGADKGYEKEGWKYISSSDHINHAVGHLMAYLQGDRGDDHLAAAAVRCMMAWEVHVTMGE